MNQAQLINELDSLIHRTKWQKRKWF